MPCEGLHPYRNRAGTGCQASYPRLFQIPACLFFIKVLWYLASLHGVFPTDITVQDPFSVLFSPKYLKNQKDFGLYVKHCKFCFGQILIKMFTERKGFQSFCLTINVPVVYMGRYKVVLRGDYT